MQTLTRALRGKSDEGQALPVVFTELAALGAKFRRGQLALVAAAPGGMKSAIVATLALRAKVPTLYVSADTDKFTLGSRVGAQLNKIAVDDMVRYLSSADREEWLRKIEAELEHIWFCFDANPYLEDIESEIKAYVHCVGAWPELIVVDNLKDVWSEEGDGQDHVRYDRVIGQLHELARRTGACVIVLHHVVGAYEDGYTAIPISGLLGKVGKTPRLILTLYRKTDEMLGICIVKNSMGQAKPDGSLQVEVPMNPATMWFNPEFKAPVIPAAPVRSY